MNVMQKVSLAMATVLLASCAGKAVPEGAKTDVASGSPKVSLEGSAWRLASASAGELAALEAAREVTMAFDEEGRVFGKGGCNRYTSAYRLDEGSLTFDAVAATKMLCIGDGDTVERAFFDVLGGPLSVTREGDALLLQAANGLVLRFVPESAAEQAP